MTLKEFLDKIAPNYKYTEGDVENFEIWGEVLHPDSKDKVPFRCIFDEVEIDVHQSQVLLKEHTDV